VSTLRTGSERRCPRCGVLKLLLVRLHGDKGGPELCMQCALELQAHVQQKRESEARILNVFNLHSVFGESPPAGPHELNRELVDDILQLIHPDRQPPERTLLATRCTAELLALRRYTKPRSRPAPPPSSGDGSDVSPASETSKPSLDGPGYRDGSDPSRASNPTKPSRYPCLRCDGLAPFYYCTACRERWDADRAAEREKRRIRRRELREWRRQREPERHCVVCGAVLPWSLRHDAETCGAACRQRRYRARRRTGGGV
jgi:hypothetical protein